MQSQCRRSARANTASSSGSRLKGAESDGASTISAGRLASSIGPELPELGTPDHLIEFHEQFRAADQHDRARSDLFEQPVWRTTPEQA
jgi:hypothetical protein